MMVKKGISESFDEHEQDTAPRAYPKELVEGSRLTTKMASFDLEVALQTESGTRPAIGPDAIARHVQAKIESNIEKSFNASIASGGIASGVEKITEPTSSSSSSSSSTSSTSRIDAATLAAARADLGEDIDAYSRPTMEAVPASLTSAADPTPMVALPTPIIELPVTRTSIVGQQEEQQQQQRQEERRESSPSAFDPFLTESLQTFTPQQIQIQRPQLVTISISRHAIAAAIAGALFLLCAFGAVGFWVGRGRH